ncbi:MAG: PKD domain-containing protein [Agriterribacter sp.]
MKRIILFLPLLLLIYVNSQAGNKDGRNSLALVANFTASITSGCGPLSVQFTSTSTSDAGDPIVSYSWNFGDGSPLGTGASSNHTFANPSPAFQYYTVSLTVTTQGGATKTETKTDFVTVYRKPVFDFGPDYSVCEGSTPTITLVTESVGGYVYNWGPPKSAVTTYTCNFTPVAGVNTFWAKVTNGTCVTTDTLKVTASPALTPKIGYKILSTCGNVQVQFFDSSYMCDPGNSITYIEWDVDGNGYYDESNPVHTFATGGSYDIWMYVEDDEGHSDDQTITITLPNPTPGPAPVNFGGDKTICSGNSVQLDAGNEPGATYIWSPATGLSSASVYNPTASPASTQTYTVTKTKCGVAVTGTVTVNVNPALIVDLGPDKYYCGGYVLLDAGVTGATYQWGSTYNPAAYIWEKNQKTAATGAGTYWVSVTKNGCTASDTIVLHPKKAVTASFTYTKAGDGTCGPFELSVTENSDVCSGAVNNRAWDFGDGTIISGVNQSVTHTYSAPGTYTVTLIVSTSAPAKDTIKQTITFTGATIAVNLGNDTTICTGNSITLDAGPGASYTWSNGETTQLITVSPTVSTNYSVIVKNAVGCEGTDAIQVNVTATVNVNLGNDTTICTGKSITLDAGPGASYTWSNGETTRLITVSPTVSTNYSVVVKNAAGCEGTDARQINVAAAVNVNLGNDTTICSGNSITLDAGPGASYTWSNGETTRLITVNPTVSTNYSVVVKNAAGCEGTDARQVNVSPALIVDLGPDKDYCGGYMLLDAGVTGATYQWGSTYNPAAYIWEKNQKTAATGAGTYWVSVTKNGCTASDTIVLRPKKAVTASFTYTKAGDGTCGPFELSVTENSDVCSGAVNNRAWDFGDGTIISGVNQSVTHTYSAPGTYTVTLIVSTSAPAKDTIKQTIIFTGATIAVNLGNDTTLCSGSSLVLDAGNPGSTYAWSTGATSQAISVNTSGTYAVEVSNGLCKATDTIQVTVSGTLNIQLGNDTTICPLNSVTLDAGNYPGATYLWSSNAGNATSQTVTVSPDDPATVYTVTVTRGTCTGTGTKTVYVSSALPVNLGNDTAICAGSNITLDAGHPGAIYLWNNGTSFQTNTVDKAGTYKVAVDYLGCTGEDSINIALIAAPVPVNLGDDINVCFGNSLILDAGEYTGATYTWSTGETTRTITVSSSNIYSVTVANGCGSPVTDAVNVTMGNLPSPVITQSGLELICTQADTYQWYKDGILIPGATNQKYKARGYGVYSVVVTNTALACSGRSADYWFVPAGDFYLGDIRLKITPNPSTGQTKLVLSKLPPEPIKMTVYDRIGRRLITREISNAVNDINMTGYAKGLYFVECVLDNNRVILPLVTQ